MQIIIREEEAADCTTVYALIEQAFRQMQESDHREHLLVERLRTSDAFIPELSLVAESEGRIIGHILLTEIHIVANDRTTVSLALAPVAVLPEYQGMGAGSTLIREAHTRAAKLGYRSVVVLGHPAYYPKFGYKKASDFGIRFPFDVPDACCMAVELYPDALKGVQGMVAYAPPFME